MSPAASFLAFSSVILVKSLHMVGAKNALRSVASTSCLWAGTREPLALPLLGQRLLARGLPGAGARVMHRASAFLRRVCKPAARWVGVGTSERGRDDRLGDGLTGAQDGALPVELGVA